MAGAIYTSHSGGPKAVPLATILATIELVPERPRGHMQAETPIQALFRKWRAAFDIANDDSTTFLQKQDAAVDMAGIEARLKSAKCETPMDAMMLVAIWTEFGAMTLDAQVSRTFWSDVEAMVA